MAEAHVPLDPLADMPDAARLDALAEVALMFPWPLGRDRDPAVGHQVAYLIDKVLAPLSRGRGALEIAIGEGLAALAVGDRVVKLGYSNIGDYAREDRRALHRGLEARSGRAGDVAPADPQARQAFLPGPGL
jgi:hypothetical protein